MAQYILSKSPLGTMYIDNMYFFSAGPAGPASLTIITSPSGVSLSWDPIPGASSYTVYASDDPYGTYEPALGGTYNGASWTGPAAAARKFYYVTATTD